MTIDAAEIARLRAEALKTLRGGNSRAWGRECHPQNIIRLLDELVKARELNEKAHVALGITRDQRDSARTLLRDIRNNAYPGHAFAARIAAELGDKP